MVPANRPDFNANSIDPHSSVPIWIFDLDRQQLRWKHQTPECEPIRDLNDGNRSFPSQCTDWKPLWNSIVRSPSGQLETTIDGLKCSLQYETATLSEVGRLVIARGKTTQPDESILLSLYTGDGKLLWQDSASRRDDRADTDMVTACSLFDRCVDPQVPRQLFDRLLREPLVAETICTATAVRVGWHHVELHLVCSNPTAPSFVLCLERPLSVPPDSASNPALTDSEATETEHRLLHGLVDTLHRILSEPQQPTPALSQLGRAAAVDRIYFYEWSPAFDAGCSHLQLQANWMRETCETEFPRPYATQLHLHGQLQRVFQSLQEGHSISSDDPDWSDVERRAFLDSDTTSILLLPILLDDRLWGVASLEMARTSRCWTPLERELLSRAAIDFGNVIVRARANAEASERDRLLDGVNWANHLLLTRTHEDFEGSIHQALQLLGTAVSAERVYVVENQFGVWEPCPSYCSRAQMHYRYEWVWKRQLSRRGDSKWHSVLYEADFCQWYDILCCGRSHSTSVAELSDAVRYRFEGMQRVTIVPIEIEGQFWGFLGLEYRHDRGAPSETEFLILGSVAGSIGAAIARHQAREHLARRDRLLDGVAKATTTLLTFDNLDEALAQAVAELGAGADADRAYLFQQDLHALTGQVVMKLRREWIVKGGVSGLGNDPYFQNIPDESTLYDLFKILAQNQMVEVRTCDLLPLERALLEAHNVRVLLMLPISVDRQLWGFLGFDRCQIDRLWSEGEKNILKAAAGNMGVAIARHQARVELGQSNAELENRIWKRTAELQAVNRQLTYNAYHDALTGLPNRTLLLDQLQASIDNSQHDGREDESPRMGFTVLFVDLDRFTLINDSLGHTFGDKLLVETASRLLTCLNPGDLVARIGGDDFAILLRDVRNSDDAKHMADRVHDCLSRPFCFSDREIYLTVSIGIAPSAARYTQAEEILRDADIVMCHAKKQEGRRYEVFDSTMYQQLLERHQLENDLRQAIASLQPFVRPVEETPLRATDKVAESETHQPPRSDTPFRVCYQPILSLSSQRVVGFEALLRWYHPQRGAISPSQFIPIAEESGDIFSLGIWVLYRACLQLCQWQKHFPNLAPLSVSVNLSAHQLLDSQLLPQIDRILEITDVPGERVKLEMTESVLIENADFATQVIAQLQERHFQLCMDDFGTGYSSLSYLHRYPFNTLKIDRSFVRTLKTGRESSSIVQAIVALAHNLGMTTIAEGVETEMQQQILHHLGCEYGQGYLFAPPLNAEEATRFLERSM